MTLISISLKFMHETTHRKTMNLNSCIRKMSNQLIIKVLLLNVQCKTRQYLLLLSIISDFTSNDHWLIPF